MNFILDEPLEIVIFVSKMKKKNWVGLVLKGL